MIWPSVSGPAPMPDGMPVADADGVILSAPALWGRATMDLWPKIALFAAARLFPDIAVSGSGLRIRASDNIPMLRALARDPMVLKGARVATVYGLVDTGVEYVTNVGAAGDSLSRMPSLTGTLPSRIGFRIAISKDGGMHELVDVEVGHSRRTLAKSRGGYCHPEPPAKDLKMRKSG